MQQAEEFLSCPRLDVYNQLFGSGDPTPTPESWPHAETAQVLLPLTQLYNQLFKGQRDKTRFLQAMAKIVRFYQEQLLRAQPSAYLQRLARFQLTKRKELRDHAVQLGMDTFRDCVLADEGVHRSALHVAALLEAQRDVGTETDAAKKLLELFREK